MISEALRTIFNKFAPFDTYDTLQSVGLGNQLSIVPNVVRGTYDFAVLGGAVGSLNLLGPDGNKIVIPNKAIVRQVWIDIITAIVSTSNDGTISVGLNTAIDLLAAVDGDTLSGVTAGIPVGTAATMVKATADRTLTCAIAVHAFTAGKFNVFVEYVLST